MIVEKTIRRQVISAEILASLWKTNPIEASAAEVLIKRGIWDLEGQGAHPCE